MNKQKGAVKIKAGQLQDGLQRFSFIVETDLINYIKHLATEEGVSMKALMDKILNKHLSRIEANKKRRFKKNNKRKIVVEPKPVKTETLNLKPTEEVKRERKPSKKNEDKLKAFLSKK